jgi:S1-C subfamily serine protease
MVLKLFLLAGAFVLMSVSVIPLRAQCATGSYADLGYGFISSTEGFALFREGDREFTRFLSNPVVHRTRGWDGGFRDNDTIIAVNGAAATTREAAIAMGLARNSPLQFQVLRDGATFTLTINPRVVCHDNRRKKDHTWLGFALRCDDCEATLLDTGRKGWRFTRQPVVSRIDPTSNAMRAGLRVGDVVISVNGLAIETPQASEVLTRIPQGDNDKVVLAVRRNEGIVRIEIEVAPL